MYNDTTCSIFNSYEGVNKNTHSWLYLPLYGFDMMVPYKAKSH